MRKIQGEIELCQENLRVGADFRLKCTGCGHQIMVARRLVEKNTKGLKKKDEITG